MKLEEVKLKKQEDEDLYNEIGEIETHVGKSVMINKEFRRSVANIIIKEANDNRKDKLNVAYKGSCIIGSSTNDPKEEISKLTALKDKHKETVDLISKFDKTKCGKTKEQKESAWATSEHTLPKTHSPQCIFKTIKEYLDYNFPEEGKINIYYVAHAHGSGQNIDVHWNCVIVDYPEKKIVWYDPATYNDENEEDSEEETYNFSITKKTEFVSVLTKMTKLPCYDIQFDDAQQRVCDPDFHGADTFCQSWVMLFSSLYINNKTYPDLIDKFAKIDFETYQTLPVKMWLKCIFKHYPVLEVEAYGNEDILDTFYDYSILNIFKDKSPQKEVSKIVKVPEVLDYGKKKPIVFSIVENFYNKKSKSKYKYKKC
jgi:hypothetical protein